MEDRVLVDFDMPEEMADQLELQRFERVVNIGEIAAVDTAPIDEVRATRDEIARRVGGLLTELDTALSSAAERQRPTRRSGA